jgi:xanthosine utilization system XapX-like protein
MDKRPKVDWNKHYSESTPPKLVPYSPQTQDRSPESLRFPRYSRSPASPSRVRAVVAMVGLVGLLVIGWSVSPLSLQWPLALTTPVQSDSFRRAVNRAMSAAELTQTAGTQEEWQTVAQWWEEAIALMKAVPPSNPHHDLAQEKVEEYSHNLDYARQQMSRPHTDHHASSALWATGSIREQVIQAQGEPTRAVQYDALCQEVLYYGNSTVELTNGTVSSYRDIDGKFRISAHSPEVRRAVGHADTWSIGSLRDEVFQVQGTPNRVDWQELPNIEVLYYGSSSIMLTHEQVVGYNNADNNLKVSIEAIATPAAQLQQSSWSLGSSRGDVLRIQGAPRQIVSEGQACGEVFYYDGSKVEFRNGLVTAYDNAAGNLRVLIP